MEFTVTDLPAQRAAAILHRGAYHDIGAAFDRLGAWMGEHLDALAGPPLGIYTFQPEGTPPDELRSYAAVPVSPAADLSGADVEELEIAAGTYAAAIHRGSYDGLGAAWEELMAAVAAAGMDLDPDRPCLEQYRDDPSATPEAELTTVLHAAIR